MPSRNFCDRCEDEIKKGDSIYSAKTELLSVYNNSYRSGDLMMGSKWISPDQHLYMLCEHCIRLILEVILRKPENASDPS